MEDLGRLLYEEEIKERRAQAELSANHIGIFVSFLVLILTWTVYGVQAWRGIESLWLAIGLLISLFLTAIFLYLISILVRTEVIRFMPIKVYDKGILMPITNFDRFIWRKHKFIHDNDLESVRLVRAHKPDKENILIATTKQGRTYTKRYDRNSEEPVNILENVRISAPQAKVLISE